VTTVIAQRELRNNNAGILDRVEAGESFTVTRRGIPVADVVPHVTRARPPMFANTAEVARALRQDDLSPAGRAAWLRDIRDAGDFIDDDPFGTRG